MKPNWDDAPEWANFLAMDDDGIWYWYEKEPVFSNIHGRWSEMLGGRIISHQEHMHEKKRDNGTLERRP